MVFRHFAAAGFVRWVQVAVFVAAAFPAVAETTVSQPLAQQVAALVSSARLGKPTIAVYAVDAATSEVVVDINGTVALKPASCNKLLTVAAGLSLLGPDFRFNTTLSADCPLTSGTLRGNLIVRGGGDPTISGRFETNKRDVTATMRRWADELSSRGITRVTGDVIADDSVFDREYFHPAWYSSERGEWYEAEISGLVFNDNCVDLTWSGSGKLPGDRAGVAMNPETNYVRVDNQVVVSAKGRSSGRSYIRAEGSNDIVATGTITVDTTKEDSASVDDGALYFASVFKDVLTSAGIRVEGKPVHASQERSAALRKRTRTIATHESPALQDVVKVVNLNSQNLYADCILKMLGRKKRGEGSFKAGTDVVREFCRRSGVFHEGHRMVDGSGLSANNRVSARQLAEVIRLMDKGQTGAAWRTSFPVGGQRGTLRSRFQQTTETRVLAGKIMGKTGLIGGVRSLSGIVSTRSGRELYYSIIVNDFSRDTDDVVEFIDRLAVTLAGS